MVSKYSPPTNRPTHFSSLPDHLRFVWSFRVLELAFVSLASDALAAPLPKETVRTFLSGWLPPFGPGCPLPGCKRLGRPTHWQDQAKVSNHEAFTVGIVVFSFTSMILAKISRSTWKRISSCPVGKFVRYALCYLVKNLSIEMCSPEPFWRVQREVSPRWLLLFS